MEVFNYMLGRLRRMSVKQIFVALAFTVALTGAISLGSMTKQRTSAATVRDCSKNSIDYQNMNGGCGAATSTEFVADARANNPGDLQVIYSSYGLAPAEYDRFVRTAKPGIAYKNGNIVVDGNIVARDAVSLGRDGFSYSKPVNINGKTYYASASRDVFAVDSIPVMVMFDQAGKMEFAVLTACGNPITGNKVTPSYACNALNKSAVSGEKDTYNFTTDASAGNGAKIAKVVYNFGDGSAEVTQTSPATAVKHKFTKTSTITVTVYVNLPGGAQIAIPSTKCKTVVTVTPPPTPFYSCTNLTPSALNDKKTQFRFTVKTSQGNGATLKDANFTLDGSATTTGVTTKDASGNIYKEYTFTDDKEHTIVATVNFNVAGDVQGKTCEAKVTAEKAPECKPGIPVGDARCTDYCKEGIPVGDARCNECKPGVPTGSPECQPPELPVTGPGSLVGLFAGSSAFAAIGHRVFRARRAKQDVEPVDVDRYLS